MYRTIGELHFQLYMLLLPSATHIETFNCFQYAQCQQLHTCVHFMRTPHVLPQISRIDTENTLRAVLPVIQSADRPIRI